MKSALISRHRGQIRKALTLAVTAAAAFMIFSGFTGVSQLIDERMDPGSMGVPHLKPGKYEKDQYLVSTVTTTGKKSSKNVYSYRSNGRPSYGEMNDGEYIEEYACYPDGNLQAIYETHEDGTLERTYHKDGSVENEWITRNDSAGRLDFSQMRSYDDKGNPTYFRLKKNSPKTLVEKKFTNSYNKNGKLSRVRIQSKDILIEERSYTYEDDDTVHEEIVEYLGESYGNVAVNKYQFHFTGEGVLLGAGCTLLDQEERNDSWEYTYDEEGYLVRSTEAVAENGKTTVVQIDYRYGYDEDRRPISRKGLRTYCELTGGQKTTEKTKKLDNAVWEYDKNGNLIKYEDGTQTIEYEYAPLSKLKKSGYSS